MYNHECLVGNSQFSYTHINIPVYCSGHWLLDQHMCCIIIYMYTYTWIIMATHYDFNDDFSRCEYIATWCFSTFEGDPVHNLFLSTLQCYQNEFEEAFLKETGEYYRHQSAHLVADLTASEYMQRVCLSVHLSLTGWMPVCSLLFRQCCSCNSLNRGERSSYISLQWLRCSYPQWSEIWSHV